MADPFTCRSQCFAPSAPLVSPSVPVQRGMKHTQSNLQSGSIPGLTEADVEELIRSVTAPSRPPHSLPWQQHTHRATPAAQDMPQGNQISDLDEYPRALPRVTPNARISVSPNESRLLGTTTNRTSELTHLRSAAPSGAYQEVGASRLTGTVTLGQTLPRQGGAPGRVASKRAVREARTEQALVSVKTQPKDTVTGPHEGIKWIGKLQGR